MSNQSTEKLTRKSTKTRFAEWARHVLKVWFTAIMLFFAGLGVVILVVGVVSNIPVVATLGSALFSTSTISAIFKVIGFDMYMTQKLSETMDENNEKTSVDIQSTLSKHITETRELVDQSITRAFSNTGFVEMLSETQCREVFKKCLIHMKKGMPSQEIYDAFQELSENLVGLVSLDRRYSITLENAGDYGPRVIKSTVTYSAKMVNQSPANIVHLFPNGLVAQGSIDTPRDIDVSKLQKPEDLGRFVEFLIDNQKVEPDEVKHSWVDENDKRKGCKFIVKCSRTISPRPSSTTSPIPVIISFTTETLLDESDYILRRFLSFTVGATVMVQHPKDLETEVTWFRPSEKTTPSELMRASTVLEQSMSSVFFPGMGFALRIRRLRRERRTKRTTKPKTIQEKDITT